MLTADNLKRPALKMDLQLFSEEGSEPAQSEVTQAATLEEFLDNYESQGEEGNTEVQEVDPNLETEVEPQVETEPELLLGKFKSTDDLAKAYQEVERKMHEQGQENSQMKKTNYEMQQQMAQVNQYLQILQQQQAQQVQQPQSSHTQPMTPEQQEEWLNKFYDRPLDALQEYVNEYVDPTLQKMVEPLQQKISYYEDTNKWNEQIRNVASQNPDFNELLPDIQQIIQEQGEYLKNMPNTVEVAYNLAKARRVSSIPKPDDLLNDDSFIEKILGNENIQKKFQEKTAKKVVDKKPPVVLGNQTGGQPPAAPPDSIKSTSDANKSFKAYLDKIFKG